MDYEQLNFFFRQHRPIVDRLENWAAWSRDGRGGRRSCFSIEGRYLPESDLGRDVEPSCLIIDVKDAMSLNAAIGCKTSLERLHRFVLHSWFIARHSQNQFVKYVKGKGFFVHADQVTVTLGDAIKWAEKRCNNG